MKDIKAIVMQSDLAGQIIDDYFNVDNKAELLVNNLKLKLATEGYDMISDNFMLPDPDAGIMLTNPAYKTNVYKHILVFGKKTDEEIKREKQNEKQGRTSVETSQD